MLTRAYGDFRFLFCKVRANIYFNNNMTIRYSTSNYTFSSIKNERWKVTHLRLITCFTILIAVKPLLKQTELFLKHLATMLWQKERVKFSLQDLTVKTLSDQLHFGQPETIEKTRSCKHFWMKTQYRREKSLQNNLEWPKRPFSSWLYTIRKTQKERKWMPH